MSFCKNCGAEVPNETKFCSNCGNAINADETIQSQVNSSTKKKRAPILGLISFCLSFVCLYFFDGVLSLVIGIPILVLSIISLVRNEKLKGFAIAAIVISAFAMFLGIISITLVQSSNSNNHISQESDMTVETSDDANTNSNANEKSSTDSGSEISSSSSDDVNPDLVAFLDSYEDFMDEYIDFMKKYYANPTDLSLLNSYADIMSEYSDFAEKIDAYDTDSMSSADAAYYLEVTARCSQKVLNALGSFSTDQ